MVRMQRRMRSALDRIGREQFLLQEPVTCAGFLPTPSSVNTEKETDYKHGTRNSKVVQRRQGLRVHQPAVRRRCFCAFLGNSGWRFQEPAGGPNRAIRRDQGPKGLAS